MATKVKKATRLSPFRLATLLRQEKDPNAALSLFLSPPQPFPYSYQCYDLLLTKLAYSRLFPPLEQILDRLRADERVTPKEPLFCHIISSYARGRLPSRAHDLFLLIPSFRCSRTVKSFNSLLDAYLRCGNLEAFESLWHNAGSYGVYPDACSYNIYMRAVCLSGSVSRAWELFDEMPTRGISPTVVTFGTLIAILCDNLMLREALSLKERMLTLYNVKPNVVIYITLIKALCKSGELSKAFKLKEEILLHKDLELNSFIYTTLIRALFSSGQKGEVTVLLEEMKANRITPDNATFNSMIAGFCEDEKNFNAAFEVLNEMQRNGCKPDLISYNTIINGFCKVARWRDAQDLFEDMPRRGCKPDIVTYRILFDAICNCKEFKEVVVLLDEMVSKGYTPSLYGTKKFLEGIMGRYDGLFVESFMCQFMKLNRLEVNSWEKVVSRLRV
ncbi:putative pentatricopeptide repeat-containing protein [Carex littledalei]|uniref:Putative pentatricopeptide repeat-containing protein n=1 Tax=Carex littledalei TaxID=544730 RepID=A0A833VHQ9_9POAL|nr:putative pentatricopeptide repeat-containing protein [Carex littledalei]